MYYKLFPEILNKKRKMPVYYFISVSNICNANCKFCDIHEKKDINTKVDIKKLLNSLKQSGAEYVHFTGGGEPLANKKIYEYFEYATELGLNIVFITNGYFLSEDKIEKLKDYNIKAIFFSIDSYLPKVHNETRGVADIYEKATYAINLIKEKYPNIKIVINHVLNMSNIDDIKEFIKLSKSVKYDYLNPIIVKECPEYYFSIEQINNYNLNLKELYDLIKKYNIEILYDDINYFEKDSYLNDGSDLRKNNIPCNILNYCSFIDCVTGNVYPCDCSVHRDSDYYSIGNVIENNICDIYNSSKAIKLKEELERCSKCKNKCDYANMYLNMKINEK